jgi:DNA mismatch repair protein MutS
MPPKKNSAVTASSMETLYFKHYDEYVQKYGRDTAILLQVGKFFEMYDSVNVQTGMSRANVQTIAEVCGCVVEPKPSTDGGVTQRIFWGFPEMSLAKFERVLVAAGYTVVVIVQNKDATGDVKSRTVDHVASPGTFWDADGGLAVRREEQCIMGVYVSPYVESTRRQQHWYVSCSTMDVMTGTLVSTETDLTVIDGKPVCDPIQPFLSTYPPAEVIVWWNSTEPPPAERNLVPLFGTPKLHVRHLSPKEEDAVAADRLRRAFLNEIFKHETALSLEEYLGIGMYHMVRRSLTGLLQFVKDHNPSYLANLHAHSMWTPEAYCLLGNAALEQLAMTPAGKRENECLLHWLQHAITPMGRRLLRERCMKPITDVAELDARQERVAVLRENTYRELLEGDLKGMADLARLYRKFQLGRGSTDDLLQILTTYSRARQLVDHVKTPVPATIKEHLDECLKRWSVTRIRTSRAQVSDAVAVGSVHPWARGVHPHLDAAEDEWRDLESEMLEMKRVWERAVGDDDCITWALREDEPFTFSMKCGRAKSLAAISKQKFKTAITVNQRGTASVCNVESPTLAAGNERGRAIRERWLAAVHETWNSEWNAWMTHVVPSGVLEELITWIGDLDATASFARVANMYGYVRPTYVESEDDSAGFSVTDLRHPILERVHTSTTYIPHSLAMGAFAATQSVSADAGILLYGVNAAGKSSLGKAIGLTVLMAQCGIPVPASEMKLIPYTGLFTRILGNDNLWAGMSSFVVEMTEFRSILRSAGKRTLVIGDELCAGTETASATSIVAAGVQTLASRGCHFFFATHLHELAEIPTIANNMAVRPYHLTVRPDTARGGALIYDRTLRPGCGSPMYGLEVCRGLDMDREFLALAVDIRRGMFGDDGRPRLSRYNAGVVVSACAVCGGRDGLETHHIKPQAAANADGFVATGVHKNTGGNLAVLCGVCHDKHHSGVLEIQGWVDTSSGRQLQFIYNK